ncbi:MAG TPA: hypothetical protein VF453_06610 [Burkholderiaceae bacterium]
MTAFQSTVNITYAFGVPGEFNKDGPRRVVRRPINSGGANPNVIGYAYTAANGTGVASVGGAITNGTSIFAGILANPKEYSSSGGSSGPLSPTLTLPDNSEGDFVLMGNGLVVALTTAANMGDQVIYNTTTGALAAVAPGAAAGAGNAYVPNCFVEEVVNAAAGLVSIRLTN